MLLVRGVRGCGDGMDVHHSDEARTPITTKNPTWCAKYRSGFMTLPPALLQVQPAVVLS
jgi:hypothetical protein